MKKTMLSKLRLSGWYDYEDDDEGDVKRFDYLVEGELDHYNDILWQIGEAGRKLL